jgi:hypothetical protein
MTIVRSALPAMRSERLKLARSDSKGADTVSRYLASVRHFGLFFLVRSVSRLGCTRLGSPGIFG